MRKTVFAAALVALVLAPAAAEAHVTLQPTTAPAGAFTRLNVRVPNERDDASTIKVDVQFPPGFTGASYEPIPGWSVNVETGPLAEPIQTPDGEITEGVKQITWTADSDEDGIPPGAFRDFGLSLQIPGEAGDELTFRSLQTYTGGEVVRWIGAEGSDNPAPIVTVTEPTADQAGSHDPTEAEATPAETAAAGAAPAAAESDDGSSNTLAILALVVGALGLMAGAGALLSARRASGGSGAAA
jgi:uncharacterized protein YcnI